MSHKVVAKIFVIVGLVALSGWQVIGHPSYLNLYASDARAKQELVPELARDAALVVDDLARVVNILENLEHLMTGSGGSAPLS